MFEVFEVKIVKKGEEIKGAFDGRGGGGEFFRGEKKLVKISRYKNRVALEGVHDVLDMGPRIFTFVLWGVAIDAAQISRSNWLKGNFKKHKIWKKIDGLNNNIWGEAHP